MKLYAVFSSGAPKKRGARGNCLIRLPQYPPMTLWLSVKTRKFRGTL